MFMHRSSLPARVLLLALVLLLGACGKPKEAALPSGTRVLALGDSLTAPHGVTPEQAWPTLLAAKTGWAVVNAGVSGDTSAGALQRLPGLIEEHNPQLVLVTLGGNDMLRRLPQGQAQPRWRGLQQSFGGGVLPRGGQGKPGAADRGCDGRGALEDRTQG
jgi:lysophospholipase L1-like esterase